jgi:hypothetical protein
MTDTLHTVWSAGALLGVRCHGCDHRAVLSLVELSTYATGRSTAIISGCSDLHIDRLGKLPQRTLQTRIRGHREQVPRLRLELRPFQGQGQGKEPEGAGDAAHRGRHIMMAFACKRCDDTGWVCEWHQYQPAERHRPERGSANSRQVPEAGAMTRGSNGAWWKI